MKDCFLDLQIIFPFPSRQTTRFELKCNFALILLYYRLLFLLLLHNPGGILADHSVAPHTPEDNGRAPPGTGLHLDTWTIPLLLQSSAGIAVPRKRH